MKYFNSIRVLLLAVISAIIIPSTLLANTTNVIGTYSGDDFESYSNDESIIGTNGWYADTNEVTAVVTNSGNGYLLLEAGSSALTNHFKTDNSFTNVFIEMDVMMNPADDVPSIATNTDNQLAIWLDSSGQINIRHDFWDGLAYVTTNTTFNNSPITNADQWVHFNITMDYKSSPWAERYFQIQTNGAPAFTNILAAVDPSEASPVMGGSWFLSPNQVHSANFFMKDLLLSGAGAFDNIIVTNSMDLTPAVSYTVTVQQTTGGLIDPPGPSVVSDGGDSPWYSITPTNGSFYILELVIDGVTNDTPSTNYQFTSMSASVTLSANFALNDTASVSNGTPQSWMQERGIYTNDYANAATEDPDGDGSSTADEYLGSTDPFDPDSILEVFEVGKENGTNFVKWVSIEADTNLPPYSLEYKTNLLDGAWTKASGSVTRSGGTRITNIWWETSPMPEAFYRVVATNTP